MTEKTGRVARPTRRRLALLALVQMAVGLLLLTGLVMFVYPHLWARALFFVGVVWLGSGGALLGLLFLHALRHPEARANLDLGSFQRQALEIGAFAAFLVWLQWGRLLTLPMVLMAGLLFIALEGLWQAWR